MESVWNKIKLHKLIGKYSGNGIGFDWHGKDWLQEKR